MKRLLSENTPIKASDYDRKVTSRANALDPDDIKSEIDDIVK